MEVSSRMVRRAGDGDEGGEGEGDGSGVTGEGSVTVAEEGGKGREGERKGEGEGEGSRKGGRALVATDAKLLSAAARLATLVGRAKGCEWKEAWWRRTERLWMR